MKTVSNLFPERIGLCGHFRSEGSFCTGLRSEGDLFITPLQGGSEGKKVLVLISPNIFFFPAG